ncbi:hypothetical protein MNBD_GAMMA01-1853 [hydrothermal vent metagenome]|uniref:Uncharacterized protein n=1 Tax=hydrothermal vent metagenome TaxID=652676 RepID=A0A3B0VJG8_9ZZZZ
MSYLFYFKAYISEKLLAQCINNILLQTKIDSIQVDTANRGKSPVLTGLASQKNKDALLKTINQNCDILELHDLIKVKVAIKTVGTYLGFQIDNAHNIVTIEGLVSNQSERENILDSFTSAMTDMTIKHDIKIDARAKSTDYAMYITLLLASIANIQLADITIQNNELRLKGLVRDKTREQQTLNILQQLFQDDLKIINQLELVVKFKPDIEALKFENMPMPLLDPKQQ